MRGALSAGAGMLSASQARARIVERLAPTPAESVPLSAAFGRVLAVDVAARRTHPPAAVSAMDGYAVRAADVAESPATLQVLGEAPAGGSFAGTVGCGQAVRIFTGGPLPAGADTVVIQENTRADGRTVAVLEPAPAGKHVRPAGLDFRTGDRRLTAGRRLTARDAALAAAMNVARIEVRRRPRVAILGTGDELVAPGEVPGPAQIVNSNGVALAAVVAGAGGAPLDLGIARDNAADLRRAAETAHGADLLVTVGGTSVGDHDLVRSALGASGLEIDFWKVAIRPGKPLMSGTLGGMPVLGLPGNPVSALVCALLFVRPAVAALLGLNARGDGRFEAVLGRDLPANDAREDYLRSAVSPRSDGAWVATPSVVQDSSQLSALAAAEGLAVRPPHAPPAAAGDPIEFVPFDLGLDGF